MRSKTQTSEIRIIAQSLDDTIIKLTQMRELLFDQTVLMVVKRILNTPASKHNIVQISPQSPASKSGPRGARVRAVYELIEGMGYEPFTKRDLAEQLRQAGHEIKNVKNALFYAVQKLLAERVIERVAQGGGGRSNQYKLVQQIDTRPPGQGATVPERGATQKEPRLKNAFERTAFECVNRLNEPFTKHELVRAMTAAGQVFVVNAERTVEDILNKFIRQGLVVQETNGREQLFRGASTE